MIIIPMSEIHNNFHLHGDSDIEDQMSYDVNRMPRM